MQIFVKAIHSDCKNMKSIRKSFTKARNKEFRNLCLNFHNL